jgi:hypothetical protein
MLGQSFVRLRLLYVGLYTGQMVLILPTVGQCGLRNVTVLANLNYMEIKLYVRVQFHYVLFCLVNFFSNTAVKIFDHRPNRHEVATLIREYLDHGRNLASYILR